MESLVVRGAEESSSWLVQHREARWRDMKGQGSNRSQGTQLWREEEERR